MELPPGDYRIVRDHAGFGRWAGPLVALASSLEAVTRPWALVLAADLPFAKLELFDYLWSRRDEASAPAPETPSHAKPLGVVPWRALGPEPLLALYRREAAQPLLAATHSGERAAVRAVALNTPEDWNRAEKRLEGP
jgi:molybdopterin-guanine dinucleotide biosynthesis protein A